MRTTSTTTYCTDTLLLLPAQVEIRLNRRMKSNYKAITTSDIERIKLKLNSDISLDNFDLHESSRRKLKEKSDLRVSKWSNTLAASREKKLRWKIERLDRDEAKRREIDAEEEELRQYERLVTIKKARKLLHAEKEKVKLQKSKALLAEVVASRKEQIEEKRVAKILEDEQENLYHTQLIQESVEAKLMEEENKRLTKIQAQVVAKEMRQQLELDKNERILRAIQEREEEANMIQSIMASEEIAIVDAMRKKQNLKIKAMQEIAKIKEDARHERELRVMKDKEDSQRREKELESQYLRSNARMEIEKMHFEERQRARKLLSDTISQDLKIRSQRELQFFIDSQKVKAMKEQRQAEEELIKRHGRQSDINESRQLQLRLIEEKKKRDAFEDLQIYELQRQMIEKDRENEKRSVEMLQKKNIEIRKFQELQIEEKKNRILEEREEALRYDREMLETFQREDELIDL